MEKSEIITEEVQAFTNVRWQIPDDAMAIITSHQGVLNILWKRKNVTQEEAAIDLIRSRKLPKIIITHE